MIDAECQRGGQITVSSTGTFKGQTYIGVIGIFTRRAAEVQCRGLGAWGWGWGLGWGLGGLCYVSTWGGGVAHLTSRQVCEDQRRRVQSLTFFHWRLTAENQRAAGRHPLSGLQVANMFCQNFSIEKFKKLLILKKETIQCI